MKSVRETCDLAAHNLDETAEHVHLKAAPRPVAVVDQLHRVRCLDECLDCVGPGKHRDQEVVRLGGIPNERIDTLLQLLFIVLVDAGVVDPDADALRVKVVALYERLDAAEEDAVLEVALLVVGVLAAPPAVLRIGD